MKLNVLNPLSLKHT